MNSENVNLTSSKAYGSGAFSGVNVNQHQLVSQNMTSTGTAVTSQSSTPLGFSNGTMANTKEKTPMCLINELARFNKIMHRYRLTNESGPAHKKVFLVMLELGPEETYNASGQSIKKAQHAAAEVALAKTMYKHPPPKSHRSSFRSTSESGDSGCNMYQGAITPTVELNALAMKRGEPAVYQIIDAPAPPGGGFQPPPNHGRGNFHVPPNFNFRGMYNQRYHHQNNPSHHHYGNSRYPPPMRPMSCCVSLKVGTREFIGEGKTVQAARHNAAAKALAIVKNLPFPEFSGNSKVVENNDNKIIKNELLDENAELKSPISLVHEVALKRNLPVTFEVVQESGPPHMRTFITKCCVGEHETEGEGNGKKVSKKRAAEQMLDELKKLPPLPIPTTQKYKTKVPVVKKKSKNLIKEQKAHPEYGQNINPISRLIQIQQAKKEKEPIYTLIAEDGLPRRRQFLMQVEVGNQKCNGTGPNKKLAKRAAAESMLIQLGYSKVQKQPAKPAIKSPGTETSNDEKQRKVKFVDHDDNDVRTINDIKKFGGCQLAPGLILMHSDNAQGSNCIEGTNSHNLSEMSVSQPSLPAESAQAIAKELLHEGVSVTAEAIRKSSSVPSPPKTVISPKQKLMYLAEILDFSVTFTDFPKGNGSEVLSLVTLSTNPPEVSHGAGTTLEESHNQAAIKALQELANSGLDNVAGTAMPTGGTKADNSIGNYNKSLVHSGNQKITNSITSRLQNDFVNNDVKAAMMSPGGTN